MLKVILFKYLKRLVRGEEVVDVGGLIVGVLGDFLCGFKEGWVWILKKGR